jgi:predicted acylesterase/phospholipase RssA
VPLVFRPFQIGDSFYVDGGVSSGTHADLVLGTSEPLDLVLVVTPMAAGDLRKGARFYEKVLDGVGSTSLSEELDWIPIAWPDCDVVR